ncbi:MAG TPA: YXWGXW repeat-containing protein [Polyangiaceae bacterium]|jgi:hypothetical protein|nr:YXWGXW repeat-containing protein [Polyangiaceae bacterium]
MGRLSLAAIATLLLSSSCVINRGSRASLTESAAGPSNAAVSGSPVVEQSSPPDGDSAPQAGRPGQVWVRGYWHWDGVRYVWERGRWEAAPRPQLH